MTPHQIIFTCLAVVLIGVGLAAATFSFLRSFVRFSSDYRTGIWDRTPWWAMVCGGLGAICVDVAMPVALGASGIGAVLLLIGLLTGWFREFRIFGEFDREEREDHPQMYKDGTDADALRAGEIAPVYAPDPHLVRRNACISLAMCLVCWGISYGIYRWTQTLHGEMGFGGLILVIPIFLGAVAGLYLAVMSAVAFLRYLTIAPPNGSGPLARREPDADAVEALRAHGALPEAEPLSTQELASKEMLLGAAALVIALVLWWADSLPVVRQFVIAPLVFLGVFQVVRVLWRVLRRT